MLHFRDHSGFHDRLDGAAATYTYEEMVEEIRDSFAFLCVAFMGYTIMVWDQIITFGDEVQIVWRQRKTTMTFLFLINRYVVPLGFMITMYAYLSPGFTHQQCEQFVKYEGCIVSLGVFVAGLMLLKRLSALYHDKMSVVWFAGVLLFVWFCLTGLRASQGYPVPHSPVVHSCTEINRDWPSGSGSASLWIIVSFDTFVVGFILARTLPFGPHRDASTIARTLAVDGLMYYLVVFAINVTSAICIMKAPPGIKNIFGQLQLHLTVTMMSRITLNLPKEHRRLAGWSSRGQPSRWQDASTVLPPIRFGASSVPTRTGQGHNSAVATELHDLPTRPSNAYEQDRDRRRGSQSLPAGV
ncbi:hypothetical protein CONPUDRAFT_163765 [Coniophora puteana RWD-64-598 SS2]|uniref:DUF6533 domain-containing protein n=1 Tax=Coniophora puteana (strain RWD-64-598) TaxID=741705 RepID=A0A5M3MUE5_CONPW|nr:uncharacterized protein CONPUDRAFT_163765 [Coniophora puteana RWD-64-598 SS2]EIW82670.1 hypothetical protein CONPUDRAFT_163765 [Coniophora puteana RWD-64-598 SS2]